ncbi:MULTISPECIES: hypothetical protein [unclassified Crossiella]|uniref:hypothetical protein n=1 Tax=unclassified Crossiella TaxID=2620835 RepID=UPI001FFF80DD|nr:MULTISPECIES: hypothetical protein [unclassified Crossiella]MCK2244767.1 hypothetical protein [Crossiella sp. S99.2]MCK2258409.1 hypothetical protein [Crossiella sp. S99.1]
MAQEEAGQAEVRNTVSGQDFGPVVQARDIHFHGDFRQLREATLGLDLLPADLRLVDPQNPDDLVGLFTGRGRLIEEIDEFIAGCVRDRVGGHLLIEAEAGMGKTALATYLACTRDYPTHVTRLPGGTAPETARTNLVAQLIARWDLTEAAPGGVLPAGHDSVGWLAKQLLNAARRRDETAPDTPVVLLVDGLDEAPPPRPGDLPLGLPRQLPAATVLIATTRPGTPLPAGLGRVRRIEVESPANRQDLLDFLDRVARRDTRLAQAISAAGLSTERFCRVLAERAGGVWIYAASVLDQLRDGHPASAIENLPTGLAGFYANNIQRWQAQPDWPATGLPLLALLAAARRPLPARQLASWGGLDLAGVKALLRGPFKPFLAARPDAEGDPDVYALRHQSLRDFCTGATADDQLRELAHDLATATREAHARLADSLTPQADWAALPLYAREHLAEHAALSGRLDRLLEEPGFLAVTSVPALLRLRRHTSDSATLAVVELAANAWRSDADRLDALHVAALKVGHHTLAARLNRPVGWRARHALWRGTAHRLLENSSAHPHPLAAVPLPDGSTLLASAGEEYVVRLREVSTGELRAELRGHTGSVQALTSLVLPDGTLLIASAGEDNLRLWHPATGTPRSQLAYPPGATKVNALVTVPMPDGTTLLAGAGPDEVVWLWDPATGTLRGELHGHTNTIWALAVLPLPDGGTALASGGDDGVLLWDPVTGTRYDRRFPLPQFNRVYALAALPMPDGTVLLAGAGHDYHHNPVLSLSEPCVVRLWDPATGELRRERHGHLGPVHCLTAVRAPGGGMLLASGGEDQVVRLWDPGTGVEHSTLEGSPGRVHTLAAVPMADGGTLLATASENSMVVRSTIRLWDLAAGGLHGTSAGHIGEVNALAAVPMPDGTVLLASGGADHVVRLWDPVTGELHRELHGHEVPVTALIAMPIPDGSTVLIGSDDKSVRLWDLAPGSAATPVQEYRGDDGGHELAVLVLPDGTRLLARGTAQLRDGYDYDDYASPMEKYEKYVDLVEVGNPAFDSEYAYELNGHNVDSIAALAVLPMPDGVPLIASTEDDGIRLWHPISGELVRQLDHRDVHAMTLVPRPDGTTLLAAADQDRVRLWDPLTGLPHNDFRIPDHSAWSLVAVPAPDGGTLLATAGDGRVVRLWDPATGELLRELEGHTASVYALTTLTLADGTVLLASGSGHGEIIVWEQGRAAGSAG